MKRLSISIVILLVTLLYPLSFARAYSVERQSVEGTIFLYNSDGTIPPGVYHFVGCLEISRHVEMQGLAFGGWNPQPLKEDYSLNFTVEDYSGMVAVPHSRLGNSFLEIETSFSLENDVLRVDNNSIDIDGYITGDGCG